MANIEAQLRLEIAQYQQALARAEGQTKKFKEAVKREGAGFGDELFGKLGGALTNLLPAVGVAGAVAGMKNILNGLDDIADGAARLNISAEEFQRLGQVAQIVGGTDIQSVTSAIMRMQRQLETEPTDKLTKALNSLGFSAENLARMTPSEAVIALSDAFLQAQQGGHGMSELTVLLGKQYTELVPLLRAGGTALREELAQVAVVQEQVVQASAAMNDAVDKRISQEATQIKEFTAMALLQFQSFFTGVDEINRMRDQVQSKLSEQQSQRDAAAERAKQATAAAAAEKAAADAKKVQENMDRIGLDVARQRAALEEKRFSAGLQQLTLGNQEQQIAQKIAQLQERLASLPMREADKLKLEAEKLKIEQEIVDWQLKGLSVQEQIASARKTADEEAAQKADEQKAKMEELNRLADETAILQARAAGDTKKADALQRELDIATEAKRIAEATGASEEKAMQIARQRQGLEDQIAKNGEEKTGKISGYSATRQGGADAARARAAGRVAAADARVGERMKSTFGGLDEYEAMQGTRLADTFAFPSLDAMKGPMAQRATEAGKTAAKQPGVESKLDDMIAVLQAGLLSE